MVIYSDAYKGMKSYYLENQLIRLAVIPELGAKIAALIYKPQNFEVFFQPTGGYRLATYGADFADFDTSGADEMFPTIDPCIYPYDGYCGESLPDHGELWSLPWTVTVAGERLITEVKGVVLPYVFSRTLTLKGNTIHMNYRVTNTGNKPLYGLWVFHGLAACDESTRLILPETESVITVHNSRLLGPAGTEHSFPASVDQGGKELRLDRIYPRSVGKTEKFYVKGMLKKGEAALTLNKGQLMYKLTFPVEQVPYLGIWINEGGFKEEYNCALEPSTGYYDSLAVTHCFNSVRPLNPKETRQWHLNIKLSPAGEL